MNPQKKMDESTALLLNGGYEQKQRTDSVSSSFSLSFLRKTMIATIFAVVTVFVIMAKTNQLRVQEDPIAVASMLGWKDDVHYDWEEFQHKYVIIEDDNTYSDEGILYLNESRAFRLLGDNDDFYYYQQGWEAQMNQVIFEIDYQRVFKYLKLFHIALANSLIHLFTLTFLFPHTATIL